MRLKVIVEALGRGEGPPRVTAGRACLLVVGLIRLEVRVMGRPERGAFVLMRGSAGAIRFLAVVPEFVPVAQVIRARRIIWLIVAVITPIVRRVVQVEDGLVLMVVDHHPADDAVHLGPGNTLCRLLLACASKRWGIKANRRGG